MRLEGRKALVTGGASGIGAAIARRLAAEAAMVVIGDLNAEGAREVASEFGGEAVGLDVTETASAAAVVEELGPFEILVNNAGMDEFGFFTETDPRMWERVIAVNLGGVLACTHAVLPAMQQAGYGRIVSIASEAGRVGSKGARERPLRDHRERDCAGADRHAAPATRRRTGGDRRAGDRDDEGGHPAAAPGRA